jgi:hypothetical protein
MRAFLCCLLTILALACGHSRSGPSFTLAVDPAQVRLLPGLSQSVTVTVTPDPGFSGTVEFTAVDPATGLEALFTPAKLTLANGIAAQATLRVTAREDTAPGKRSLSVQAAGPGSSRSVDLLLDIPSAAFFTVITYRGSEAANFAYLAYQDGAGAWTAVPGNSGVYRLPISDPAGRFGVLLGDVCQGEGASTWISNGFFSTLGETQSLQALVFCNPHPGPPPVTFDLRGALAGAAGQGILIGTNSGLWSFPAGATGYALQLIKGTSDLVAAAYPDPQDYIPARIIIDRGRDAQAPMTRDFDFSTQGEATPARLVIQRPALDPGEVFQGAVQFQTARGQVALLGYGQDLGAYAPVPAALTQPGDGWLYSFRAIAQNQYRVLQASGSEPPGALAPRLPPNIPPFSLTTVGGATPRLRLAWSAVTPAPNVHEVVITQQVGTKQAYCYLYFGQSWHAGASQLTWTQPDLSAIPGFDPGFFPQAGTGAQVALYQSGSQTRPVSGLFARLDGAPPPTFAAPLDRGFLKAAPASRPGMQLNIRPTAAPAVTGAPWTEYWAVHRAQTIVP